MPSLRSQSRRNQVKSGDKTESRAKTPEREVRNEEETSAISTPVKTPPAGMKSPSALIQAHQLPLPPTQASETPSPYQVMSDCIDATSYEILMISDLSSKDYAVLNQRIDYYLELMDHGLGVEDGDEELVLKDAHVRERLYMARMVINLCSRDTYPNEDGDCRFPPLIDFTVEQWKDFRDELATFSTQLANQKPSALLTSIKLLHKSIERRMEAMEAFVHLKNELTSSLTALDAGETFTQPKDCIAEYVKVTGRMKVDLQTIHRTRYDDFFIPNKVLSNIDWNDGDKAKLDLKSLINRLGKMVSKESFPLRQLQVDFSRLTQECNVSFGCYINHFSFTC